MRRSDSNPSRVLLSGVLDFVFYFIVISILFMIFDRNVWPVRLHGRVFPVVNLLCIWLTIVYILFLLPLLDYQGGSMGKRILGLRCVNYKKASRARFDHYLRKYLVFGLPILSVFAFSFRMFGMKEDDVILAIRISDAVLLLVLLVQIVSLFTSKRSLFERLSGTMVVHKNYQHETELFSFEKKDDTISLPTESINE